MVVLLTSDVEAGIVGNVDAEPVGTTEDTGVVVLPNGDVDTPEEPDAVAGMVDVEPVDTPEEIEEITVVVLPVSDVDAEIVGAKEEAVVLGSEPPLDPELGLGQLKPEVAIDVGFEEIKVPSERVFKEVEAPGDGTGPLEEGLNEVNVLSELVLLKPTDGMEPVDVGLKEVNVPSELVFEGVEGPCDGIPPVVEGANEVSVPSELAFELEGPSDGIDPVEEGLEDVKALDVGLEEIKVPSVPVLKGSLVGPPVEEGLREVRVPSDLVDGTPTGVELLVMPGPVDGWPGAVDIEDAEALEPDTVGAPCSELEVCPGTPEVGEPGTPLDPDGAVDDCPGIPGVDELGPVEGPCPGLEVCPGASGVDVDETPLEPEGAVEDCPGTPGADELGMPLMDEIEDSENELDEVGRLLGPDEMGVACSDVDVCPGGAVSGVVETRQIVVVPVTGTTDV
ncbi:hypothetical protein CC80DRAFT_548031 [Byssothecium circinans]|uniref:Uncharacterized protein n=1 Tax=Byssothecium circinans TaxID=147558 RepID=A0A6A5TV92_9PLEO|nr:hypothetical protein CC80DRAFT_548031 [Byssothecium circinans]